MLHDPVLMSDSIRDPLVCRWILHVSSHHLPSVQVSLYDQFSLFIRTQSRGNRAQSNDLILT